MNNFLHFWSAWLRGPHRVGAVAPSSPVLARAMVSAIDDDGSGLVVELGAGTGAITRVLVEHFPPERLLIIERDPHLVQRLQQQFPRYTVLAADAGDLVRTLQGHDDIPVRTVVSALPLLSLPTADRQTIVKAIADTIGRHGQLIQFTYGLGAPIPRRESLALRLLGQRKRYVLWNLPPAMVWEYRKQRPGKTSGQLANESADD